MSEFNPQAEALWTYTISKEKIFKRLVENNILTQEIANEVLELMYTQLNINFDPNFKPSPIGEKMRLHKVDYDAKVSLTEIARNKNKQNPGYLVQSWMRNDGTVEFLRTWELKNNKEFDNDACDKLLEEIRKSGSTLTPKLWSERTKAKGIVSLKGKGGGTKADPDIALAFRSWLDPNIMLEMIERFKYYEGFFSENKL